MKLATQVHGTETGRTPLVIAHGLFGSARNWGGVARVLASDRQVIAVDMRNHASSPWDDAHDYESMAGDLAETIPGRAHVLGHSMGGKAAMMLALRHPERVARLVVADIAPVAYAHTQLHLIDAMERLDLERIASRGEADRALAQAIEDRGVRAFLLQSLDVKAGRWRLNLPALREEMPGILGFPEVNAGFDGPVLFLSGAESDYVRPEHRRRIKEMFPRARFARIPGAGHWLHADKPREFSATVAAFLD